MDENKVERPLCLELEEARAEIFTTINHIAKKHNLPFFLIEPYVAEAARQVGELAKKERESAESQYLAQLTESNKE